MKLMTIAVIESKTAQFLNYKDLFTDCLSLLTLSDTLLSVYSASDMHQLSEVNYSDLL